jgi:HEAT repeat protein
MIDQLIRALVGTKNEAADELLLEVLRIGTESEQLVALAILMQRKAPRGLAGIIEQYEQIPPSLQRRVLNHLSMFYTALRESGRSDRPAQRLAALKLIALGRLGKLAYVLSENLHEKDEAVAKAACDAMVGLARWISVQTRRLQRGEEGSQTVAVGLETSIAPGGNKADGSIPHAASDMKAASDDVEIFKPAAVYAELMSQRPEIETAVARALDAHRGPHGQGQELLNAALLLCDWAQSKTLAILQTAKHGGQSLMVRRLQQPPLAEHVEAFLLGASHGQLRSHFGSVFAHIAEAPVLDALLRKTHWLRDAQLQLCMHQVTRGTWWSESDLARDLGSRHPSDAARIGEWIAASGMHDLVQDERLELLRQHAGSDVAARIQLLRLAAGRKRGSSVNLIKLMLADPDERIARMAAREIIRRRPPDFENTLIQLMTGAGESVRRVVGRAIGQVGFDHYWQRFDRMDRPTRRQAGRAMLKLLPDAIQRLSRQLQTGPLEQRLKAMQMTHELGLSDSLRDSLLTLVAHPNAKVRSKAVTMLGGLDSVPPELLLERAVGDTDGRVRANAIEVLETARAHEVLPLLLQRARSSHNRERANAIKALHRMRVATVGPELMSMLKDERPEHKISALWLLQEIGWWTLLGEVGKVAKADPSLRVRRYALGVLKSVAELIRTDAISTEPPPPPAAAI